MKILVIILSILTIGTICGLMMYLMPGHHLAWYAVAFVSGYVLGELYSE